MNNEIINEIINTVVLPLEVCITYKPLDEEEARQAVEAFEAKQAEDWEAFKLKQQQEKKQEMIDKYVALFDTEGITFEERVIFCSKQMQLEAKEGVKILGKKNAKIEKDRAKLDDTEERQRTQLARKQAERRQAFEEKNQASLKETTDIVEGEIAIWDAIKDLYEDTGPMLK